MAAAPGSNKKTYTILAYVFICAPWIGGLVMMFVGKDDPDVKWNGANSTIIFGSLFILAVALSFIGIGIIFSIISLIVWVYFLIKSLTGNGEKISTPLIGPAFTDKFATQLADAIH